MPSTAELYNQEVLEGHREALAALRELLAAETDPTERRKLANAILKTRRVTLPEAQPVPTEPPKPTPAQAQARSAPTQPPTDFFNPLNPLSPLNPLQTAGGCEPSIQSSPPAPRPDLSGAQ